MSPTSASLECVVCQLQFWLMVSGMLPRPRFAPGAIVLTVRSLFVRSFVRLFVHSFVGAALAGPIS
eukprot:2598769-Alexandrium_andersonii.AAC.2